ncbi:MAG: nucleotidyltransferase [Devosia sp.]
MASMRQEGILERLLWDIGRKIQLPPSKHETAERQYRAITDHIDREGSPLEGLVEVAYPSGSFAIHAAIASRVKTEQYDVDIVVELNLSSNTSPREALNLTFKAINGEYGSRYHGKVRLHSRCVTVEYEDGVSIDIMPVVRLHEPTEKASKLFHYDRETAEEYYKDVNPYGFAKQFNDEVGGGRPVEMYRRRSAGGLLIEAEAQPLPAALPLEDKPLRVVALQLLKRHRIVAYRRRPAALREPPSVVQAALALEAGPPANSLTDEVLSVAHSVRAAISRAESRGELLTVYNPAFLGRDEFTDRWPEDQAAQQTYSFDLRRLIQKIDNLANRDFDPFEVKAALEDLFGEAAADYAINEHFSSQKKQRESGALGVAPKGRVGAVGAALGAGTATAVKANTNQGGEKLEDLSRTVQGDSQ